MVITVIRAIVLYFIVILSLRLMGKRQVGELQPEELVITILISECAAAPLQDLSRPVINGIIAIFTLVILEVGISMIALKWAKFRRVADGLPTVVIQNGQIKQKAMKHLRLTIEDLTSNLRQMGYFDLKDIAYCLVETDGNLSVLPAPDATPATAKMVDYAPPANLPPCILVADGILHVRAITLCGLSKKDIDKFLQKEKTPLRDVFILTVDSHGEYTLIKKEKRP